METFRARQAVAVLLVTLGLAACSRKPTKAEQIAALEGAYQSGVLTKDEYDVKKAALVGTRPAPAASLPSPSDPSPAEAALTPPQPAPVLAPTPAPTPAPVAEPESAPAPAHAPAVDCDDPDSRTDKEKGTQERIFPMPVAAVMKAAFAALKTLDFNIHSDANHEIEATKKRHIGVLVGAGGERVILRFKAVKQGTQMTAETKKSFVGRVAQKSWTSAVLAQTACNLKTSR